MTTKKKVTFLQEKFLECAFVKDAKKGYIVAKEFNLSIDPDILQFASRCWAEHYHDTKIDAIVGLPDAGARLVSILGEMLRVKTILPSKRSNVVPGAWNDVVSYTSTSFTTNQDGIKSHFGFVKPKMRILLVDDVVAYGSTAIAAINALNKAGAKVVGLAVLFDKSWQKGVAKVKKETGIKPFSLINIKKISPDGTVHL